MSRRQAWVEEARAAARDLLVEVELTARWVEQVPDGEPIPQQVIVHRKGQVAHLSARLALALAEVVAQWPLVEPPDPARWPDEEQPGS